MSEKDFNLIRVFDRPEFQGDNNPEVTLTVKGNDLEDAIAELMVTHSGFEYLGDGNFRSAGGEFRLVEATVPKK